MTGFDVIIPVRFESTRLPGKALLDMCGKTLVRRVYEAGAASNAEHVIVATDDSRIYDEVTSFGGKVCMTAPGHSSGSDRIAEVVSENQIPADRTIVNLQGDEPFLPSGLIDRVAMALVETDGAIMATASHAITDAAEIDDPNVVKVVTDKDGLALYFSRYPIPYPRDGKRRQAVMRHIGLYACRAGYLSHYLSMDPCLIEQDEQLEQLRVLYDGGRIAVCESSEAPGPGVDTPADLERARDYLSQKKPT
jgi:3-deoxy-manno-octulosonate cytidylyltransferase (CMP-KDO synthetase)